MHRSTSTTRRACALGTTVALIGLTTGLGVFTSTAAFAVEGDAPTPVVASADPTQPAAPTDAAQPTDTATTPAPTDAATAPTDTDTAAPAPTGEPTAPATTAPAGTVAPAGGPATTKAAPSAVAATVTIVGDAKVGTTLRYDSTGIGNPSSAVWTVDGATVAEGSSYLVPKEIVGKTITLTVTGATPDQTATATTKAVTEDVQSADETAADAPLTLSLTAGEDLSRSFAVTAGSGDVTYSVGYTDPSYADPDDPETTPESFLPDGVTLDPTTGLLSGTPYFATDSDFTIIASNGTSTATEYVQITVEPAAAVGILAWATDTSSSEIFDAIDINGEVKLDHPIHSWIIMPDGSITTITQPGDLAAEPTFTDGGTPTVKQGGSLLIDGSPVDEFGNATVQPDEDGNTPAPTVTSDVASDQIGFDQEDLVARVTFPHASTHHLTVAQSGLSVSFPVTVLPTAATVGTTPTVVTPTTGQLAFTGTDATGALPWALGFVAAGAGLLGAGVLRRRRAQR
ncbi:putative Ig domain-containing protein [Curtobacterium sp. ER1/6]|uniref:putative Ig domain-containing protein n=1 Tax=Curtobacterium sp. ER1/6 TaxID=1891920 RepID=UPI00084F9626|nr:putative Ig domain-containing protein [Curtobacterium sp. ER1/6]